jgi:hypothetical protein
VYKYDPISIPEIESDAFPMPSRGAFPRNHVLAEFAVSMKLSSICLGVRHAC